MGTIAAFSSSGVSVTRVRFMYNNKRKYRAPRHCFAARRRIQSVIQQKRGGDCATMRYFFLVRG